MNIIAHNILAMNAQRMYGINTNSKKKSAEKLSSGYKINRAADDAAGLSISEKMRKMIRGLNQGSENIQDGISLIHVADGAMEEMTSCLDRIYELSVKAYNGTNSRSDREDMQSEINQILDEIERIADTTKFNELHVLQQKPFHYVETIEPLSHDMPDWLSVSDEISFDNAGSLENGSKVQLEDEDDNPYFDYLTNGYFFPFAYKRTGIGDDDPSDNVNGSDDEYDFWGSSKAFESVFGINPDEVAPDGEGRYSVAIDRIEGRMKIVGAFSEDLIDNASATIDFSGLKEAESGKDLYDKLLDLLGTSIAVPCMTHSGSNTDNIYGVSFVGEKYKYGSDSTYITGNGSISYGDLSVIDLNNMTVKGKNIFDYAENATKTNIATVADDIAKALCAYTVKAISEDCISGRHFNMAYPDTDYKLVIYDVRDKAFFGDADPSGMSNTGISTDRNAEKHLLTKSYDPPFGDFVSYEEGIWIQCSSENTDWFNIDLPYITNERLGIEGYTIARYNTKATVNEEKTRKAREKRVPSTKSK